MLKSLPLQLILSIVAAFFLSNYFDFKTISVFYTISCLLKEVLMSVLPFVIFSYIAAAVLSIEQKAPLLILSILVLVTLSNAFMVLLSYAIGINLLPLIAFGGAGGLALVKDTIEPLFSFNIPAILPPDQAMLAGMVTGLFFSFVKVPVVNKIVQSLRHYITVFLQKCFIPLLPLYVFGFVLKMEKEGILSHLVQNCGQIFIALCGLIILYLAGLYLVAGNFRLARFIELIRTMLPAGITGFSTMSSVATMPVTLAATEKNTGNPQFAQLIIPATANIHLTGDALAIPVLALAVLNLSGLPFPGLEDYMLFTVYFCIAKFSVAGIPGGGIIVMLPLLQKYMGLTPEMISLLTTIYIIQDPVFTSANVMGNGAFAILVQKITRQKAFSVNTCP